MPRLRQRRMLLPVVASFSRSGQWPQSVEMATALARWRSIFPFGDQCQRSAGTNRVLAAAERNIRTAAGASRNLARVGRHSAKLWNYSSVRQSLALSKTLNPLYVVFPL